MTIQIDVQDLQKRMLLRPNQIIQIIKKVLRHEGVSRARLSLVLVTPQRMKALNQKYLNHCYATDVLAFDLRALKGKQRPCRSKELDGEVIVSTTAAVQQARKFGMTPRQELALYIVHGILHLLGFDDHRPNDIERFRAKEKEILTSLNI